MAPILLKIHLVKAEVTKALQFDESMTVYDVCRLIQEKIPEAKRGKEANTYGLYQPDDDPTMGVWLQPGRILKYYNLQSGCVLEYRTKQRPLRVKTLDAVLRTVLVDESQLVSEVTKVVCAKIGIHNPQEFSFTVDDETDQLTLKRHEAHEHDKSLEILRRQMHTDDQLSWLDPARTLREQGLVDETAVLTLRKKFFFTDENVNANDPVQLHLLYVQCHEAMIEGTHPVTREEAVQLAALHSQIQFGNYEEARFKKGFLKPWIQDLVPDEYRKDRKIEPAIFDEHRKLFGMSEMNAKFRYIELCRSLRTYGVSFFAVKEKIPGRNKLRIVLLGVSRESVMRLDRRTKEVLKVWPLTTVSSYAATPHSFSLNFGEYAGSVYQVKTSEGEHIIQLLDGYIELILQTKRALSFEVPEVTEPTLEESLVAAKHPNVMKVGRGGAQHGEGGALPRPSGGKMAEVEVLGEVEGEELPSSKLAAVQKLLREKIATALAAITQAEEDMRTPAELPSLGGDKASVMWKQRTVEVSRHKLSSHLTAILASSASMITLSCTDPKDTDYAALASAVSTIGTNMQGVSESSRLLATLSTGEDDSGKILDAARAVAEAMRGLLTAGIPEPKHEPQELVSRASDLTTRVNALVRIVQAMEIDGAAAESYGLLLATVCAGSATLAAEARKVAGGLDDAGLVFELQNSVMNMESSVQALTASVGLLSACLDSPLCQEKMVDACKVVAASIEELCQDAQAISPDVDSLGDLAAAAATVTEALTALLQQVRDGAQVMRRDQVEESYEALLAAARAVQNPSQESKELLKNVKILVETTRTLMQSFKAQARQDSDPRTRRKLLEAIKDLAGATSKLAELAKKVATTGNGSTHTQLVQEAEHVVSIATAVVGPSLRKLTMKRLQLTSRHAATAAVLLVTACDGARPYGTNDTIQEDVMKQCKQVSEQVALLVHAFLASVEDAENPHLQLELINTAKAFIPATGKLVATAKQAVPSVSDSAVALTVGHSAKYTAVQLGALRSAINKAAEFCGFLVIDTAIGAVQQLILDFSHAKEELDRGELKPLPGQTLQSCSQQLVAAIKAVEAQKSQLVRAASEQNSSHAGYIAREMVASLETVVQASCGLAAISESGEVREGIFSSVMLVLRDSERLMSAAKLLLEQTPSKDMKAELMEAARRVTDALKTLLNFLPGQAEFERAIQAVLEASKSIDPTKLPSVGDTPYSTLEESLTQAAAAFLSATTEVVAAARGTPTQQAEATCKFTEAHQALLTAGLALAVASKDEEDQSKVLGHLRLISGASSKLLVTAKAVAADPTAAVELNQLNNATRSLVDAVNKLLSFCSTARPGVKECDGALRELEAVAVLLETATEPVTEFSYYSCIDCIGNSLKALTAGFAQLVEVTTQPDHDQLMGECIQEITEIVCDITEATSQAAYLVGVADPTSTAATPVVVDQVQLGRCCHLVSVACQSVASSSTGKDEVTACATTISKQTSAISSTCKLASTRTSNPLAKKEFLKAAKVVVDTTADLLKSIDLLSQEDPTEEGRRACSEVAAPLLETLEQLTVFAASPEFNPSPAKISQQGIAAQTPILLAGKGVHGSTVSMVTAVRAHIIDPEAFPVTDTLPTHAKTVTDAVEELLKTLQESCPGLRECDTALSQLESIHHQLGQASHKAMQHALPVNASSSLHGFLKQAVSVAASVGDGISPLAAAAKGHVEVLGEKVTVFSSHFPSLADASIGAASRCGVSHLQLKILDHSLTLVESAMQLVTASKTARGNPHDKASHQLVDKNTRMTQEALSDFTAVLEDACSKSGLIGGMADEIMKAMSQLEEGPVDDVGPSNLPEQQARLLQHCEALARAAHEMVLRGSSAPEAITSLRRSLTSSYGQVVRATRNSLAFMDDAEGSGRLLQGVYGLGESVLGLLYSSAGVQVRPEDPTAWHKLIHNEQEVKLRVSQIVAVVQACGAGTLACLRAIVAIRDLVGDIDITAALLTTAGSYITLGREPRETGGSFREHRERILAAARVVAEATQNLVQSARGPQDELARAANEAVLTLNSQADIVKKSVASLSSENVEEQLLLLTAVKDVAHALEGVVEASSVTSGMEDTHPSIHNLQSSAKRAEVAGTRLLRTVSSIQGDTVQGLRVLQNAIDYIDYGIEDFDSQVPWPRKESTIPDLRQATKNISLACAKAVAAGRSLHAGELSVCAGMARNSVTQLLGDATALAWSAESEEDKSRILTAAHTCAVTFKGLIEQLQATVGDPTEENKRQLPILSEDVASCVQELLELVEEQKGLEGSGSEEDDDLPATAASIVSAAEQFSEMLLEEKEMVDFGEVDTTDWKADILEVTKTTAIACGELVRCATEVHGELVPKGEKRGQEEEQWSKGLLAATKALAEQNYTMCETANLYVQSKISEDRVIESAKSVAGATAQLFIVAQIKVETGSEHHKQLQTAAASVKHATDKLISMATRASTHIEVNPRPMMDVSPTASLEQFRLNSLRRPDAEVASTQNEMSRAQRMLAKIQLE